MSINTYINNYQKDENLKNELDTLFNSTPSNQCYYYIERPPNNTLSGINTGNLYIIFSYLIPNLFRSCYSQDSITIPAVCPSYITETEISNYLPKIIERDLIKSFFYFNFPCSISYDINHSNEFLKSIYNKYFIIRNKKVNTTYGSYTVASQLMNFIYSPYSLLIQIKNLNNYIDTSNTNGIIAPFTILWDFTELCESYSTNNSYIIGNNQKNNVIDQSTAQNIYDINNSALNINTTALPNNTKFLLKNNIYSIINIVNEVYEDVTNEIDYFLSNKIYCQKNYMNLNNIPELLKIYNNYYKNQVYSNSKALINENIDNIIVKKISIETYVEEFIAIYIDTYDNRYYVKTIYLSSDGTSSDALVFFSNFEEWVTAPTDISYWYFYININNPSAVELFNANSSLTTYTSVTDYTTYFNSIYNPKYTIIKDISYINGGLYPDGGMDVSSSENIGISYYFAQNGVIKNIIYETLLTPLNTSLNGIGLSLIYV